MTIESGQGGDQRSVLEYMQDLADVVSGKKNVGEVKLLPDLQFGNLVHRAIDATRKLDEQNSDELPE